MWQTVAVGVVALVILGLFVWYRLTHPAPPDLAAEQLRAQQAALDAAREAETVRLTKAKKDLDDAADKVLATQDPDAKLHDAIELLAKLRGVR